MANTTMTAEMMIAFLMTDVVRGDILNCIDVFYPTYIKKFPCTSVEGLHNSICMNWVNS
jgi:hypothetical protein